MKKLLLLCMIPLLLLGCGDNGKGNNNDEGQNSTNNNIQVLNTYSNCDWVYDTSTNSVHVVCYIGLDYKEWALTKEQVWIISQKKIMSDDKTTFYELSNKTYVLVIYI